jgi:hypothetical protein
MRICVPIKFCLQEQVTDLNSYRGVLEGSKVKDGEILQKAFEETWEREVTRLSPDMSQHQEVWTHVTGLLWRVIVFQFII